MSVATGTSLVEARGLSKTFGGGGIFSRGGGVQAVRAVDAHLARGEAVGLVGESGSGKSTLGRLLLGLLPATDGELRFDGQDLKGMRRAEWRRLRRRMGIVFQDPMGSLDPRRRVGAQIADGLDIHGLIPRAQHAARVAELLEQVGLDPSHAVRFPHEFSGGQRQRIGIARALATGPDFLVADEPVSALDVSIQAQVVALLDDLRRRLGLSLLFISHDLPVVRHLCDRVMVMYLGRVMEEGPSEAVFANPSHPYTRALLSATPRLDPARRTARILLAGDPPSPANPPSGCVFRTRCAYALPACGQDIPALRPFGAPGQRVACIRAEEIAAGTATPAAGPARSGAVEDGLPETLTAQPSSPEQPTPGGLVAG
ncbi:ABC transporter ATP-binding protein [Muricoccus radiodurans]|uniref:ABC transporter ATP-binding protein n=1 Tax=Muricoccus radiodurans TaxID=2231721 RepID=UPI003CED29AF